MNKIKKKKSVSNYISGMCVAFNLIKDFISHCVIPWGNLNTTMKENSNLLVVVLGTVV